MTLKDIIKKKVKRKGGRKRKKGKERRQRKMRLGSTGRRRLTLRLAVAHTDFSLRKAVITGLHQHI